VRQPYGNVYTRFHASQTAARSIQPFLHRGCRILPIRFILLHRPHSKKVSPSGPHLHPPDPHTANGTPCIKSVVLPQYMLVTAGRTDGLTESRRNSIYMYNNRFTMLKHVRKTSIITGVMFVWGRHCWAISNRVCFTTAR